MDATLRFATTDDLDAIWDLFKLGFGGKDADRQRWMSAFDPERALVAEAPGGQVAAASHIRTFRQWFGGRAVPLAGYSPVAVAPEHRGRGLGRAITAGHFADLRDRGEVIAGLYPASVQLYRSVGFELAGSYVHRRIPAAHLAALQPGGEVTVRRGTLDDVAAVHRCYDRLAGRHDGPLVRDDPWWARRLPVDLVDTVLYVVDDPSRSGELDGYASYRQGPGRAPYDYSVVVSEVQAAEPAQLRALWRTVGSSGSQAPDVDIIGAGEDPLFLLLGGADPTTVRSEIRWMLRLVDVAGAVAARGWNPTAAGQVDLSITDDHAPWNHGRWRLTIEGGDGRLVPGGDGTVEVGVGGLSSWWAGYASARTLAVTGHLHTRDAEALATLDGLGAASPPTLVDFY
ncbi:MAG: acetyltransferase involved in intracellular survival and related acetyltransferase-like protein [Acidimicrobiales bacterium]|nr:acetyltransferase involved in intracellular survival and related acetyltransferase-like protein [Acidimicrobiales bacterium]